VIVTEIYPSREPKQDFSSAEVVSGMPHLSARFIASLEETAEYLLKHLRNKDVLLVLSAGDADQISADVLAGL
jgi:UDP-N-acetylmuramate--alanine ligase